MSDQFSLFNLLLKNNYLGTFFNRLKHAIDHVFEVGENSTKEEVRASLGTPGVDEDTTITASWTFTQPLDVGSATADGHAVTRSDGDGRYFRQANDLSEGTPATMRSNLGLGSAAVQDDDRYAHRGNNLSDLASAATAFGNIKQAATESATGVVEQATTAEAEAGTAGVYPDAAGVLSAINANAATIETETFTLGGDFDAGEQATAIKIGNVVTITANSSSVQHADTASASTSTGALPSSFRPSAFIQNIYAVVSGNVKTITVFTNGTMTVESLDWTGSTSSATVTSAFSISYVIT